ncbi:MAG TPA: ureidoglycolate lyase [Sedimentisphaerales bacterium]|nr:ureidoglycolate lyase [Sedimentisphaerales bacterium]
MRKEKVKELSQKSFARYGVYANMINPRAEKLGAEPIEFFRDMAQLDLGGRTLASFSTCRVCKRPPVVDVTEFHNYTGEGILPLDADALIHVAPATPTGEVPLKKIEIFRVPKGTFVSLHPGVWHHAPFADNTDVANVLIVLPERTYAQDCHVTEIAEKDRVEIA